MLRESLKNGCPIENPFHDGGNTRWSISTNTITDVIIGVFFTLGLENKDGSAGDGREEGGSEGSDLAVHLERGSTVEGATGGGRCAARGFGGRDSGGGVSCAGSNDGCSKAGGRGRCVRGY